MLQLSTHPRDPILGGAGRSHQLDPKQSRGDQSGGSPEGGQLVGGTKGSNQIANGDITGWWFGT